MNFNPEKIRTLFINKLKNIQQLNLALRKCYLEKLLTKMSLNFTVM